MNGGLEDMTPPERALFLRQERIAIQLVTLSINEEPIGRLLDDPRVCQLVLPPILGWLEGFLTIVAERSGITPKEFWRGFCEINAIMDIEEGNA